MGLFNILVDIAARTASFESGIQRVEKGIGQLNGTVNRFSRNATNVLGVAVGFEAIRRSIGAAVQRGDELDRLSQRMKTSVEFLSQMQFVAGQSDVQFKTLANSIDTLRKNVSLAADGLGKARPALKALGIDAKELASLPLDRQMELVADRIAGIENPTLQTRLAIQLMGDAAADLLPVFNQGADGIRALRQESDRLGQTLSTSAAKRLAEVDNAIKRMKASSTGLTNQLAVFLAPAIVSVADSLRKLAGGATDLEKLESKLAFLEEQGGSFIPFALQFGYIEGASMIMGPKAIEEAAARIRAAIATIKREAAGETGDGLTEIVITAQRKQDSTFKRFVNPQTMLEFERNVAEIEALEQRLVKETERNMALFQAGLEDGIGHGIAATAEQVDAKLSLMVETTDEATQRMQVFWDQGMRNMQDTLAQFLFNPFKDGLRGMLKGFVDVLRRMASEAAAAKIFESIGGLEGIGGFFASLFTGSTGATPASTGASWSGPRYAAGTNFVPRDQLALVHRGEQIIPAGMNKGMGGVTFAPVYNIDARGATHDAIKALPEVLKRNNDALEARIVQRLRSGKYG